MSEENVDAVRALFDAWNRGDVEAWLKPAHPDVEWSSAIIRQVEGSDSASYRGHEELGQFWRDWHELWDLSIEPLETRDLGETVLFLGRMHTRGNVSGVDLNREIGWVCEFEDGLVRRVDAYLSAEAALEAVGLSE